MAHRSRWCAAWAIAIALCCVAVVAEADASDIAASGSLLPVAERRGEAALPGMDFNGPRDAWQRLTQALHRGDRAGAMQQLTPNAQERYAKTIDDWLQKKPFDEARFGRIKSVTLSGARFATVNLTRKKDTGTYGAEVMMMRDDQGKWRVDRMPED